MEKVDLSGKVAIVTGAGKGLGRAYALDLAKHGAKVVVNDLGAEKDGSGVSKTPAEIVSEEIKSMGGEAAANFDNVVTNAENIIKTAMKVFGSLDILVNNAGILADQVFSYMDEKSWDNVISVHLKGAFSCIKAAWPVMKKKRYGRIVNISSGAALFGNIGQANYATAKCGIIGLTNVLKLEGYKRNILTNVVVPIAASRMTQGILPPDIYEKSRPELVAPLVTYLCSEQCLENGSVFNAGIGYFSRSAIMTGRGWISGNSVTADDILVNFKRINSLEDSIIYDNLSEQIKDIINKQGF